MLALVHELGQLRHDLVHVADDAEVGELEDRRVGVLVDRDDDVRALHAHLVLDRAGDAERDVELRRDCLPGLADLRRVRIPAGVDDGARRADGASESARELLREGEVLGRAETAAAGDDDVGILDRRTARLRVRLLDHARLGGEVLERDVDRLHVRGPSRLLRVERAGAEQREPRRARPADVDEDGVLQRRPLADEIGGHVDEIPVETGVESRGKARGDIGGEHGVGKEHGVVVRCELGDDVDARLRQRRLERGVVGDVHRLRAVLAEIDRRHAAADEHGVGVAERRRLRQHAERALLRCAVVMLDEDENAHTRRFSARKSTIACAASPSPSILRASPRAGGAPSASTSVFETASTPMSASDSVSNGFFFAPMIPFSDGYLGSLIASLTATTAGRGASITSYPNSVCRFTRTVPSATVTSAACETTGRRRRSATAAHRTAPSASEACCPKRTRSAFSRASAPASTVLVATRSEPAAASSETSTARSAPIASAFRSESAAFAGPIETATTSPSPFSRSASSTAFASKWLSAPSPDRSRRFEPGSIRPAPSGTCLMQTAIFTPPDPNYMRVCSASTSETNVRLTL